MEVNHHGCSFSAPQPFKHGTRVRLGLLHNGQVTTARVVYALPLEPALKMWRVGLELDKPENVFWDVPSPPTTRAQPTDDQSQPGRDMSS